MIPIIVILVILMALMIMRMPQTKSHTTPIRERRFRALGPNSPSEANKADEESTSSSTHPPASPET